VKSIDLSVNKIGKKGVEKLSSFLSTNIDYLTYLNLANNDLGDLATIRICKSMKKHSSIHTIILDHNRITDHSCKSIQKLESNAYTLKVISLYWNLIQ